MYSRIKGRGKKWVLDESSIEAMEMEIKMKITKNLMKLGLPMELGEMGFSGNRSHANWVASDRFDSIDEGIFD